MYWSIRVCWGLGNDGIYCLYGIQSYIQAFKWCIFESECNRITLEVCNIKVSCEICIEVVMGMISLEQCVVA